MQQKKLIAVASNFVLDDTDYNKHKHMLSRACIESVLAAGAIPIMIPAVEQDEYVETFIRYCLENCAGLMIMGGNVDVDPSLYGKNPLDNCRVNSIRTNFEIRLISEFLKIKKPILGICNGMQLLNVYLGGSLFQEIIDGFVIRAPEPSSNEMFAFHDVKILKDSWLYKVVQKEKISVNSCHRQCVDRLGVGVKATSVAADGVITSIEAITDENFVLGIQWHPEYTHISDNKLIIDAFIMECIY